MFTIWATQLSYKLLLVILARLNLIVSTTSTLKNKSFKVNQNFFSQMNYLWCYLIIKLPIFLIFFFNWKAHSSHKITFYSQFFKEHRPRPIWCYWQSTHTNKFVKLLKYCLQVTDLKCHIFYFSYFKFILFWVPSQTYLTNDNKTNHTLISHTLIK